MQRVGRNLVMASLSLAPGESIANTPLRLWQHVTHFALDCRVEGQSNQAPAALCTRLGEIAANTLHMPRRQTSGPDGVVLVVDLTGKPPYRGTLHAERAAFEGETVERSPTIAVAIDTANPEPGFALALKSMRAPTRLQRRDPLKFARS